MSSNRGDRDDRIDACPNHRRGRERNAAVPNGDHSSPTDLAPTQRRS